MPTTLHLWKSYVVPAALGGFLSPAGIQSPISAVGRRGGVSGRGWAKKRRRSHERGRRRRGHGTLVAVLPGLPAGRATPGRPPPAESVAEGGSPGFHGSRLSSVGFSFRHEQSVNHPAAVGVTRAAFSWRDSEGAPQPRAQGGRGRGPAWAHRGAGAPVPGTRSLPAPAPRLSPFALRPALLPGLTCRAEQTVTALRPSSTTAPTRPSPPPPRRTRFVQPVLPSTPQTQPGPGDRKATAKGVDAWTDDGSGPATLGPAQDGAAPGHMERRRRGSEGTVSPPSPHGGRACLLLKHSCLRSRTGRRPWLGCVPVSARGGPCVGSLELLPQVLSLERQNTQNWLTQGGVVVRE